jgi:hypothetical protein
MNKTTVITLLIACISATSAVAAVDYEKNGWLKLRDLEVPALVKKEVGSQEAIPLLTIENPGINLSHHLVAGELRFSNVEGSGYIEMWTEYPDGNRYFTRTMGNHGPMAMLEGSSEWRSVMLPFHGDSDKFPTELEINVILPGGGEVELRGLALYQSESTSWWSAQEGGLIGAVAGTSIGLLGGLCGALAALGKARRFVMTVLFCNLILGILLLCAGVFACFKSQPYEVYFPLFLLGGVLTISGAIVPTVRKAYIQRELRQITAAG